MTSQNDAVADLARQIAGCRICRDTPEGGEARRLPYEPRPVAVLSGRARVLIAGQAPGMRVHLTGIPFNDPSGDRLRQWMGVDRAQFYDPGLFAIVPMGFCFPGYDKAGGDLPPRRECARRWRAEAIAAMPQIGLVLAIGAYAQAWHLGFGSSRPMTETVRDWRFHLERGVLPLPHPSWRNTGWLKKNPWFESELLPDLKRILLQWIS
jgi:uracil-DNA glycosylase